VRPQPQNLSQAVAPDGTRTAGRSGAAWAGCAGIGGFERPRLFKWQRSRYLMWRLRSVSPRST